MVKQIILVICVLFAYSAVTHAQPSRKIRGKVKGKSYSYYIMEPSQPAKGIVLLMPSRGEEPKKLFWHTAIPRHLAAHGFITIVPKVDYALILEEKTRIILEDVTLTEGARAGLTDHLLIGGFSSGGAIAAHYAEYRLSTKGPASVTGVFLIDPPLDMARLHHAWVKLVDAPCPAVITSEARFIKKYVEQVTGGPPQINYQNYLKLSAFTATDPAGGNAQSMKDVPVRLYTEPDLKAIQDKYCASFSYQNLNSSDLDALHQCLKKLGNNRVEYIKATGRGVHSWNIVDAEDLARWAETIVSGP